MEHAVEVTAAAAEEAGIVHVETTQNGLTTTSHGHRGPAVRLMLSAALLYVMLLGPSHRCSEPLAGTVVRGGRDGGSAISHR